VTESFWRALADGGWPQAARFLAPGLRGSPRELPGIARHGEARPDRVQVAWIAALQGDERQATIRYQVEVEYPSGRRFMGCADNDVRFAGDAWYLTKLPTFGEEHCRP
jgi:hypothetical protein